MWSEPGGLWWEGLLKVEEPRGHLNVTECLGEVKNTAAWIGYGPGCKGRKVCVMTGQAQDLFR